MSKIAFCFPGQGSFEAGMGRDFAAKVPAARRIFERGSDASGLDLERLCFHAEAEELFEQLAAAAPDDLLYQMALGALAARRGDRAEPEPARGRQLNPLQFRQVLEIDQRRRRGEILLEQIQDVYAARNRRAIGARKLA